MTILYQTDTHLFIDPNIPDYNLLKNCIKTDVSTCNFDDIDLSLIKNSRIGFIWENNRRRIPFGLNSGDYQIVNDISGPNLYFFYFSEKLINFLIDCSDTCIQVDFITCSLNDGVFLQDIYLIKKILPSIQFNYSINNTGNNPDGDWILESSNQNIKDIYFNANIEQYNHILAFTMTRSLSDIGNFTRSGNVYTLQSSSPINSWSSPINVYTDIGGCIFDGNQIEIIINVNNFIGLFSGGSPMESTPITFQNFNIKLIGNIGTRGGTITSNINNTGIFNNLMNNKVTIIGNIGLNAGGLVGYNLGATIMDNNIVNITGNIISGGGIAGGYSRYFQVSNLKLIINGNILYSVGAYTGGGLFAAYSSNATIINSNIIINGNVGDSCGGVFGSNTDTGIITVFNTNIIINGNIEGNAGGFFACNPYLFYLLVECLYIIINGNIGENSGGFCAPGLRTYQESTFIDAYIIISGNLAWAASGIFAGNASLNNIVLYNTYVIIGGTIDPEANGFFSQILNSNFSINTSSYPYGLLYLTPTTNPVLLDQQNKLQNLTYNNFSSFQQNCLNNLNNTIWSKTIILNHRIDSLTVNYYTLPTFDISNYSLLIDISASSYVFYPGVNLSNANLMQTKLYNCDLTNSNLTNANLTNADISECNLTNINLTNCKTGPIINIFNTICPNNYSIITNNSNYKFIVGQQVNLSNVDVSGINLSNLDISGANFSNSMLVYTNFKSSNLTNVNFTSANLIFSDLSNSTITNTNFTNSYLAGSNMTNLIGNQCILTSPWYYNTSINKITTIYDNDYSNLIIQQLNYINTNITTNITVYKDSTVYTELSPCIYKNINTTSITYTDSSNNSNQITFSNLSLGSTLLASYNYQTKDSLNFNSIYFRIYNFISGSWNNTYSNINISIQTNLTDNYMYLMLFLNNTYSTSSKSLSQKKNGTYNFILHTNTKTKLNSEYAIVATPIIIPYTGGDPYINPIFGSRYLVPNEYKYANLYIDREINLHVNCELGFLKKSEIPENVFARTKWCNSKQLRYMFNFTYYRKLYIKFEESYVIFNTDTLELIESSNPSNSIRYIKSKSKQSMQSLIHNHQYPITDYTLILKIFIKKYVITLISDIATDERHYLSLINYDIIDYNTCYGGLVSQDKLIELTKLNEIIKLQ